MGSFVFFVFEGQDSKGKGSNSSLNNLMQGDGQGINVQLVPPVSLSWPMLNHLSLE
jgi:hypothetical protein